MSIAIFIDRVLDVAEDVMNEHSQEQVRLAELKLKTWIDSSQRHLIYHYFDDELFGACYAFKKFQRQTRIFTEVLNKIVKMPNIKSIMISGSSIVSFGCGPGPEIAAYIHYIRHDLKLRDLQLNITAIDRLEYWREFISKLHENADLNTFITFQNQELNSTNLERLNKSDICLMLFPHSMNFDNLWSLLIEKFHLIILVDNLGNVAKSRMTQFGFKRKDLNGIGIFSFVNNNFGQKSSENFMDYDQIYDWHVVNKNWDVAKNEKRKKRLPDGYWIWFCGFLICVYMYKNKNKWWPKLLNRVDNVSESLTNMQSPSLANQINLIFESLKNWSWLTLKNRMDNTFGSLINFYNHAAQFIRDSNHL